MCQKVRLSIQLNDKIIDMSIFHWLTVHPSLFLTYTTFLYNLCGSRPVLFRIFFTGRPAFSDLCIQIVYVPGFDKIKSIWHNFNSEASTCFKFIRISTLTLQKCWCLWPKSKGGRSPKRRDLKSRIMP